MKHEQEREHSWENLNGSNWIFKCPHCGWLKIIQPIFFKRKRLPVVYCTSGKQRKNKFG